MNIKRGQTRAFLLVSLFILLGFLLYYFIPFVQDYFADPILSRTINYSSYPVILDEELDTSGIVSYPIGEMQFYQNMRFNHNMISYSFYNCPEEKKLSMENAMLKLSDKVPEISFSEVRFGGDINITCDKLKLEPDETYFVAGEGGPTEIINTSLFSVILNGKIMLLYDTSCNNNIDLHELLHVFGFRHSDTRRSIMYNFSSCDQILTQDIISRLRKLYSVENYSDLYFSDVQAVKKGRYLDFDVDVRNQGLVDVRNVIVSIYADGNKIDDLEFGDINFGEGRIIHAKNIKIPSSTEKISFIIDEDLIIEELSEKNNFIELMF